MKRRPRVIAGVWALALSWAAGAAPPARAQDPAPAVDVTVVGTAGDLERVRALVPRLSAGGARWLRVDRLDPADVLRDRPDGERAAVRAWVDVTSATRARLYFAIRSGNRGPASQGPAVDRFLVRDVDLSGRFDEVDRAALAEVLESSIGALVANERAGLTRAEAEAVLARRVSTTPAPAVTAPPPPPPQAPPPSQVPPRWAIGFFYAAQALADDASLDHGPGIELAVAATQKFANAHDAGRGPVVFASAQYRLPAHERASGIGVALYTVAARAGVECGPLLLSRLRVRVGAGADFVHVSPESTDPIAVLTPARWSTSFVATAALRLNILQLPRRFWLSAMLFADVLPTAVRYDAAIDGATTAVFSPWRVRPGLNLELTFY